MVIVRLLVWIIYLYLCIRVNPTLINNIKISFKNFKPVLKFSIWISIANIVGPMITYSDRIIIGGVISTAAITYYSTPYEVVTKLLLIPGALVGVLFPVFSASFAIIPEKSKSLFMRGVKYIFLVIYPLVFLIVVFAFQGIEFWLGNEFAENSSLVMQLLSIGILMNSLSLIPNIFFQGTGKPHVPTLLNMVELPFYIFGMWYLVVNYGIKGAAFFYMSAAAFDALVMYFLAYKVFGVKFNSNNSVAFFVSSILVLFILISINIFIVKIILSIIILFTFIFCVWYFFLTVEEKRFLVSKVKLLNIKNEQNI